MASQTRRPAVQPEARVVPEWLDIIAKLAAPVVLIVVAAGLYNLVPELVRGTKESFNRVAAQVDFKGNLSQELYNAFR